MLWKNLKNILLSILSGAIIAISFPKFNLSFLIWVAFIPLLVSINKSDKKTAFFYGLLTGTISNCVILYWLVPTFTTAGEPFLLGLFCLILLSTYIGIYTGIFCFFLVILKSLPTIFYISIASSLWVFLEYLRSHLFTGFPWALLGYTQWNFLTLIQIADITGIYGISFLIILVNLAIFQRKSKSIIFAASIFLIFLIYGTVRLKFNSALESQPKIKVSILQGNIDQYKKWNKKYEQEIMDTYKDLALKSSKEKPEIIIWPESAIPGYLLHQKELYDQTIEIIKRSGSYHLIGSSDFDYRENLYNSAMLFSPEGDLIGKYNKIHLVPFGETIPLQSLLSKYINVLNELGDFSSGKDYTIFEINKTKLSASICFESIFPHLIRKFVINGAEILVNLTNDGWYLKTSAPYQHFYFNIFRAIENRRPVVRAANTGISGVINQNGEIEIKSEIFEKTFLTSIVEPSSKMTFYTKCGDIFAIFCSIFSLGGIIWRQLKH